MAKAARKKPGPKKAKRKPKSPKTKPKKTLKAPKKAKPLKKSPRPPEKILKKTRKAGKKTIRKPAARKLAPKAPPARPAAPPQAQLIKEPKAQEFLSPPEAKLLLPGPETGPQKEKPIIPEPKKAEPKPAKEPAADSEEKIEPILPEEKQVEEMAPILPEEKKEEKIEPILPEEKPPEGRPEPKPEQKPAEKPVLFQSHENRGGALAVETEPALELLPAWEDRIRLRRMIFEDGMKFNELSKSSPSFGDAFNLLSRTGRRGFRDMPGYFMICVRDRAGAIIGAMDGHLSGDVLVIGRSGAGGPKKRDIHILMYASAMAGRNPRYVAFAADKKPLDFAYAGELILLGRGFGMSAIPSEKIVFIRRIGKELDPICSGAEVSMILNSLVPFYPSLGNAGAEMGAKRVMPLVMLPASPDSREHLHELRDAAESLGIRAGNMDELLEELKKRYVLGREDITPDLL